MHRPKRRRDNGAVACDDTGPAAIERQVKRVVGAIFGVYVPNAVGQQARRAAKPCIAVALSGEYRRNPVGQCVAVEGEPREALAFEPRCCNQRVLQAFGL